MASERDYYEVLGVPRDADEATIKRAYHKLAMKWHPDRNKSPDAEAKFKEIAKAYAILKDPQKRTRYDAQGMEGVAHFTPEDLFGGLDLGDLFGDMGFGGGSLFDRLFGFNTRATRAHGQDLRIRIEVPLELIAHGGKHKIRLSHPSICETCRGYGTANGKPAPLCPECRGSGRKAMTRGEQRGGQNIQFQQITVCPQCHGNGTYIEVPCASCGGYGKVEKEQTLKITIPQGIEDGTVLRIAGHGLPAEKPGSPPGDLHVAVYTRADPRFQRRGADLWRTETLQVADAVLGTIIEIPSLEGKIKVRIPAGTQPDDVLRVRQKGLPGYKDAGRGDINLRIVVSIPKQISEEEKQLYRQLKNASHA